MAKEKILAHVATLLEKFSERLVRTARETRQNTDNLAALRDETRLKVGKLQESVEVGIEAVAQRQWALHSDRTNKIEGIAVDASVKAERAHKALIFQGERIDKIAAIADDRETRQTARDQNNVQALVNLRDSTQKAFSQVRDDVASILKQIQRLNERVGQVESRLGVLELGPAAWHQMVGVEKRVTELEAEIELITSFRKAQAAFILGPSKTPKTTVFAQGTTGWQHNKLAASEPLKDADPRATQGRG